MTRTPLALVARADRDLTDEERREAEATLTPAEARKAKRILAALEERIPAESLLYADAAAPSTDCPRCGFAEVYWCGRRACPGGGGWPKR